MSTLATWPTSAPDLSAFLVKEWLMGLRLTTIPQALKRLSRRDNMEFRWQLGRELEGAWRRAFTSPEKRSAIETALGRKVEQGPSDHLQKQVAMWHLASIVLTDTEKLVARYILMAHRAGGALPGPWKIAEAIGIPRRMANNAIRMLARVGLLDVSDGRRPAHYSLASGHESLLQGLGFSFHTVTLVTGERFGVP